MGHTPMYGNTVANIANVPIFINQTPIAPKSVNKKAIIAFFFVRYIDFHKDDRKKCI